MSEAERVQFKLMLPAHLKEALEESAHDNRRSLSAEIIERLHQSLDPDSSSLERLNFFEGQFERLTEERAKLYEAFNNQDRMLQQMQLMHRNFVIVAKGLGKVLLEDDPDKNFTRQALAMILSTLDEDDSSDPSEEIPKQPWEY